jgi:DNA repair exonuclease SbcCD nuclease subunit
MKIAIITDTDLGNRNDHPVFLDAYLSFFETVFFPYLKKNGIDTVIHMGDLLDRRKYVNISTMRQVRTRFTDWFAANGVTMHCVIGNHDCYWKNTNAVNSLVEVFGEDFVIHEKPKDVVIGGMVCGFVPWIAKDNAEEVRKYLETSNADVLFGHFELNGYEVIRGIRHEGGMDASVVSRFKKVYSGHFHCKQRSGNVEYLGTPYQMMFSEVDEAKGFHVLDTETGSLEFVENPVRLYDRISYDASMDSLGHGNFNFSKYKNCFVRLVVTSKKNQPKFDMFCDKLFDAGIHDLQIVENSSDDETQQDATITEKELSRNTIDLIDGYIDDLKIDGGSDLKNIMREIYVESLSL